MHVLYKAIPSSNTQIDNKLHLLKEIDIHWYQTIYGTDQKYHHICLCLTQDCSSVGQYQ